MNKIRLLLVLATTLFIAPLAVSQNTPSSTTSNEDLALLKEDVKSQKKQIVAANLKLTDAEAVKFWPIYDQYSAELGKLNDTRLILIKEYADAYPNISDNLAQSIVSRWLQTDEAAAEIRS